LRSIVQEFGHTRRIFDFKVNIGVGWIKDTIGCVHWDIVEALIGVVGED